MGISIVYAGFVRLLKMLAGIDGLASVARTSFVVMLSSVASGMVISSSSPSNLMKPE